MVSIFPLIIVPQIKFKCNLSLLIKKILVISRTKKNITGSLPSPFAGAGLRVPGSPFQSEGCRGILDLS